MVRIVTRIVPVLLAASCAVALAAPAAAVGRGVRPARATAARGIVDFGGYAWINLPSSPDPFYSFDSQTGTVNAIPFFSGYQVTFPNLGFTGGIAQVTPFNTKGTCSIEDQGSDGAGNENVFVNCFTLAGHPVNASFDVVVAHSSFTPHGTFDYAWMNRAKTSGSLSGVKSYNSAGKANSSKHLSTGNYQVTLGGKASTGTHGTVKVSASGFGPGNCVLSGWHGTSKGQVVDVHCYKASGAPLNHDFLVIFANRTNIMGLNGDFPTVNALVSSTGRVQTQYDSVSGAHVTVAHSARGAYHVHMNGTTEAFTGGDVQVSAVTGGTDSCEVVGWIGEHTSVVATVHCFDRHGRAANSAFTIQFVEAFLA